MINLKNDVKNLELQKDKLDKEIKLSSAQVKQIEDKKSEIRYSLERLRGFNQDYHRFW